MAMTDVAADLSGFLRRSPDGRPSLDLLISGARCAGCLSKIERNVAELPGVQAARLNLTSGRLNVLWDPGAAAPSTVVDRLKLLGYGVAPFDPAEAQAGRDDEGRRLAIALGVAGFGVGNAMMFTVPVWAGLFGQELEIGGRTLMYWLSALVAAPCTLYAGQVFFRSAWASLRRGRANMDVPISIGVLLTLVISFFETAMGGAHAYFDAAVTLVFLLLIGRYLDHKLRTRADSAARDLVALQAPRAILIGADGTERAEPLSAIRPDDRLAVAPGQRVPADGWVEAGASEVDMAMVTGESLPQPVAPGAFIPAGALNLDARLVVRAAAAAEDSTVAEIGRLIEAGTQSKSRYVRLADRAASLYIPLVHSAAALTFIGWLAAGLSVREALLRAAAVLIVTCPCALGLAVPAVLITASGRLFRRGVLVKSGAALERLAEIDHVVFDKTGVLTEGMPRLIEGDISAARRAAPLARASRHPLSRALAAAAGPGPVAAATREIAGQGIEGEVDGRPARLGRAAFVGATTGAAIETELWFGVEGEAPVRFLFDDALRPDALATVQALKALGLSVEILSGDVTTAVGRVAHELGVVQWRAGLTPAGKVEALDRLRDAGLKTLMVGDGLNDAAALAAAHASIAPGTAADVSRNAADLVLLGDRLSVIPSTIQIARSARARALENFGFSALYNLVAAPAAMLGLVSPLVAAVAMSGSSLVVTLNALRLAWAGREDAG